jgi:hypothetical protein
MIARNGAGRDPSYHGAFPGPRRAMKRLLLVSFHCPPFNAIAAVRTGKFARFLLAQGWDVRVVAARSDAPATLPLEIPAERVLHTGWTDVDARLDRLLRLDRRRAPASPAARFRVLAARASALARAKVPAATRVAQEATVATVPGK